MDPEEFQELDGGGGVEVYEADVEHRMAEGVQAPAAACSSGEGFCRNRRTWPPDPVQ